ncbi:unnamed protein product, partial [Didymodactylos carnosus]
DTFRYIQDKIVNTTVYWKCEDRSYPGRAIQYGLDQPNSIHPVFGTTESLQQLSTCDNTHLFMDATFKSCPRPFYQLYTIHSINDALSTPKLYTLLPDKKGSTYISLLNGIQNLFHMNNICINPTMGFQPSFINAKSSDPDEINIRTLYKKTCSLAFMPPQEVGKIWTLIMDQFQDIEHIEIFYDYVTSTWVDADALFDLSLSNYFDFKSSKANNSLEGWEHRLNTDLNHIIHPHFYMFIRTIQNDYAYNSAILSRHTATSAIPPRRKKLFVNRNARLHDLNLVKMLFRQATLHE